MRLAKNEICPIHRSRFCCGREKNSLKRNRGISRGPVTRIEDPHAPNGFREKCTDAELRRRALRALKRQDGICAWCHQAITDIRDASPDHIEPRGFSGAMRNDSETNICCVHKRCNFEKGSRRFAVNSAGLYIVGEKQASNG